MALINGDKVKVLDCGYVQLIEIWGADERIIEAARMSTQGAFRGWGPNCPNAEPGREHVHDLASVDILAERDLPGGLFCKTCCKVVTPKAGDEKLLAYLWKNGHATPFEMAGAIFEVKAPIMVFREWHRHRTQGYNEMSARYEALPDESYVPTVERMLRGGGHLTKQAGTIAGADVLTPEVAACLIEEERAFNEAAQRFYERKLQAGVPKELARTHLGVSRYSRMRATANLRNWLAFLTLRDDAKAQWEIREFAREISRALARVFPRTLALFKAGRPSAP